MSRNGMNEEGMNEEGMNDAGMNEAGVNQAGMNGRGDGESGANEPMNRRPDAASRDTVISTRVRLARNFADIPFSLRSNDVWAAEVIRRTSDALMGTKCAREFELHLLRDAGALQGRVWMERHLLSADLLERVDTAGILINRENTVSIMMNEEDHLRIQALYPGFALGRAAELAMDVDDAIERNVCFAFDERWGYLTTCPTNAGTGMRASVMMHLPALVATGNIPGLMHTLGKVGLTVRGMYGEGSEALGAIMQISNQVTLGRTEDEILATLETASRQVIEAERSARRAIYDEQPIAVGDRLLRALGVLKFARKMDSGEFMGLISEVRLGVALGLIEGIALDTIDALIVGAQPASLSRMEGRELDPVQRDVARAAWLRDALRDVRAKETGEDVG